MSVTIDPCLGKRLLTVIGLFFASLSARWLVRSACQRCEQSFGKVAIPTAHAHYAEFGLHCKYSVFIDGDVLDCENHIKYLKTYFDLKQSFA